MSSRLVALLAATLFASVLIGGVAAAGGPNHERSQARQAAFEEARLAAVEDVAPDPNLGDPALDHQHGENVGHLPATRKGVKLVSKLTPTSQFGDVVEGQIADLAVHDRYAYLNSWEDPDCARGGVYVTDIRRPDRPAEAGFIPALPGNYHGEGAQALMLETKSFKGDVLAVNNERCADVEAGGGFDLYDVSNPRKPRVLVQGFGDTGPEGSLVGDELVHDSHSAFIWQAGGRAFIVSVDNVELNDVDIFEITDPSDPQPVGEFDLVERFPEILDETALGDLVFHHDVVVKKIDGTQTMLSSYWDAGYVKLDVDQPANPTYIGDTSFDGADPLTGLTPPEGNAHQGEFSSGDRFFLAADEDFSPYRPGSFSITTGENAGEYDSASVGGGAAAADLPDRTLNGPVTYGGYGCDASAPVPQRSSVDPRLDPGEEAILVLQRGPSDDPSAPEEACFPGEKAANADAAGWDAVLLVNRHLGDASADDPTCGSGGFPPGAAIVTLCTTHEAFHRLFGSEPRYELPVGPDDAPPLGTVGEKVEGTAVFDGWGYAHLYRNETEKLGEVDAYAIPEALDARYASGFGDLSIHEFATDPKRRLAYSSYYAGGFRAFQFGSSGLRPTGAFIDRGGNNFWGVEQFTSQGKRLIALSDRDYGLYVLKYKGPGSDD